MAHEPLCLHSHGVAWIAASSIDVQHHLSGLRGCSPSSRLQWSSRGQVLWYPAVGLSSCLSEGHFPEHPVVSPSMPCFLLQLLWYRSRLWPSSLSSAVAASVHQVSKEVWQFSTHFFQLITRRFWVTLWSEEKTFTWFWHFLQLGRWTL